MKTTQARLGALAGALSMAVASTAMAAGRIESASLSAEEPIDQFIVGYRKGSSVDRNPRDVENALEAAVRATGRGIELRPLRRLAVGAQLVRSNRKLPREDALAVMRQLASHPDVEYVEADRRLQAFAAPTDSRYGEQWQYFDATGGIAAEQAWTSANGSGVVVAVIDTGITAHSDLDANVVPGYDFISDPFTARDGDGRDPDPRDEGDWFNAGECGQFTGAASSWHGTHVAGSVAALTDNAIGVAGTAFAARISPVRVLGKCGGTLSDVADAIVWASGGSVPGVPDNAHPAEVINLSLGAGGGCGTTMQLAVDDAVSRGTALVVAAGNSSANVSGFTPAGCNDVIAVASTTRAGERSGFSNYGDGVDLAAPGSGILSTLNAGTTTPGAESFAVYSGTSMAAPHVAGVAALVQSVAGTPKSPPALASLLIFTARPFPVVPSVPSGSGIVDATAAVQSALGQGENIPPSARFAVATSGLTATFTDGSLDADGMIASRQWAFGDGATSVQVNPSHTYDTGGTYEVTLSVTDNAGASSSRSASVTVFGGTAAPLSAGESVGPLSGATGSQQLWKLDVPPEAYNVQFATSGGSGNVNLYGRYGSPPTFTSFDCRSSGTATVETCRMNLGQAGTYYVLLHGASGYSDVSLTGSYTLGPSTYTNDGNIWVNDRSTAESWISVSGRTGKATAFTPVDLNILHNNIGDLIVDLLSADGTVYNLHNRSGGSTDNLIKTVLVDLSSESLNGGWRLRVTDTKANGITGLIDSWSITF